MKHDILKAFKYVCIHAYNARCTKNQDPENIKFTEMEHCIIFTLQIKWV
jgi:hypothetical protein